MAGWGVIRSIRIGVGVLWAHVRNDFWIDGKKVQEKSGGKITGKLLAANGAIFVAIVGETVALVGTWLLRVWVLPQWVIPGIVWIITLLTLGYIVNRFEHLEGDAGPVYLHGPYMRLMAKGLLFVQLAVPVIGASYAIMQRPYIEVGPWSPLDSDEIRVIHGTIGTPRANGVSDEDAFALYETTLTVRNRSRLTSADGDPLGDSFCYLLSPARDDTNLEIVWAEAILHSTPRRSGGVGDPRNESFRVGWTRVPESCRLSIRAWIVRRGSNTVPTGDLIIMQGPYDCE